VTFAGLTRHSTNRTKDEGGGETVKTLKTSEKDFQKVRKFKKHSRTAAQRGFPLVFPQFFLMMKATNGKFTVSTSPVVEAPSVP
jgi:hypothetical protein